MALLQRVDLGPGEPGSDPVELVADRLYALLDEMGGAA